VTMTVGELRKRLQGMDPKTHVVVYREDRETDPMELFEVIDASLSTGSPTRVDPSGRTGFAFERNGSATWLFISIVKS
jgi:hypothetical protein